VSQLFDLYQNFYCSNGVSLPVTCGDPHKRPCLVPREPAKTPLEDARTRLHFSPLFFFDCVDPALAHTHTHTPVPVREHHGNTLGTPWERHHGNTLGTPWERNITGTVTPWGRLGNGTSRERLGNALGTGTPWERSGCS